jgi:hypothetical protein
LRQLLACEAAFRQPLDQSLACIRVAPDAAQLFFISKEFGEFPEQLLDEVLRRYGLAARIPEGRAADVLKGSFLAIGELDDKLFARRTRGALPSPQAHVLRPGCRHPNRRTVFAATVNDDRFLPFAGALLSAQRSRPSGRSPA